MLSVCIIIIDTESPRMMHDLFIRISHMATKEHASTAMEWRNRVPGLATRPPRRGRGRDETAVARKAKAKDDGTRAVGGKGIRSRIARTGHWVGDAAFAARRSEADTILPLVLPAAAESNAILPLGGWAPSKRKQKQRRAGLLFSRFPYPRHRNPYRFG